MRIEATKEKAGTLPLNPTVLDALLAATKLYTTYYSTMIEGNQLNPQQVKEVIELEGHFPGRERDEREVKAYYAALSQVAQYAAEKLPITQKVMQHLHALVMGGRRTRVKPTAWRTGQNVIKHKASRRIVYMPPEAKDVAGLMRQLVTWLKTAQHDLPIPIVAAIAHYQFATIHHYYDGNGRTARLLITLILHLGGYDLKDLYSLEEYYAKDLAAYYQALRIGPTHNYYEGRAKSDITAWITYFLRGMAFSFEQVIQKMVASQAQGHNDHTPLMRLLDPQQRKVLSLLRDYHWVTSQQIGALFGFKPRTRSALCKKWVTQGFLAIADPSLKGRKYKLADKFHRLLEA